MNLILLVMPLLINLIETLISETNVEYYHIMFLCLLDDYLIFIFYFVDVIYHIDFVEPTWNKANHHLIMMIDTFSVLLNIIY